MGIWVLCILCCVWVLGVGIFGFLGFVFWDVGFGSCVLGWRVGGVWILLVFGLSFEFGCLVLGFWFWVLLGFWVLGFGLGI